MIAFKGGRHTTGGRRSGLGGRFIPLVRYLAEGQRGTESPHRLIHFATRHLPAEQPLEAGFLMACCAEQRRADFELPVYHFGASAAPGENLTPAQWEQVADWMLEELGLTEHESAIFVHDDRGHQHVHIVVNRVPPSGKPFSPWMDYPKMRRAMRHAEQTLGLRQVAEPLGHRSEIEHRAWQPTEATRQPAGAAAAERHAAGGSAGAAAAGFEAAGESAGAAAAGDGSSQHKPARVWIEPTALANQPGLSDRDYRAARENGRQPLADAVRCRALPDFLEADSWADLEARIAHHGLRLEAARRGGGVVVWTDADEPVSVSKIDRRLSGPKLANRFGEPFKTYRERVPESPPPDAYLPIRRVELTSVDERVTEVIELIQKERATFTEQEVRRHVKWQHNQAEIVDAVLADRRVERTGLDAQGRPLFTTRAYRAAERDMLAAAAALRQRAALPLPADAVRQRLDANFAFLADEQRAAVLAATTANDLPLIAGRAGSGKTAMARAIVDAYRAAGMRVQAAALTGKAAEGLGSATGVDGRTLASLRRAWAKGYDQLDAKTVLLVDEAGMLGTREMGELLATAQHAGTKVVLIGDPDQLRSIEAGDAFAGLLEIYRGSRLDTIRRQRVDWMRDASTDFADGRVADALSAYDEHGAVHWSTDLGAAKWDLVSAYFADVKEHGDADRLILARRNADVDELNDLIRARRRQRSELGRAIRLRGREIAEGDRVVFTRNDHDGRLVMNAPTDETPRNEEVGVKNGTLGTLVHATREGVHVQLDDGRRVAFDPRRYQDLRVGYAVTLHKSQGATVDRAFALLDPHLDRHGAYVAATRHRDHLGLWFDHQSFADLDAAARTLGRRGPNDLWFLTDGRANDGAEDEAAERLRRAVEKDAFVRFDTLLTNPGDLDERELIQGLPELAWVDADHVTTHEYLDAERHLGEVAERLSMRVSSRISVGDHLPPEAEADPIVRAVDGPDLNVFEGNRDDALDHFRAISDQYHGTDRDLIAVAFTSRAAHDLSTELGIESHTFSGLKYRTNRLGAKTVILVDQANLADVRTLDTVLKMAEEAGSRVVLVGDPNGFDPIGAGDAFRLVREDLGAVALRPELEASVIEAQERFQDLDVAGRIHIVGGAERQIVERYLEAPVDERPMILTHTRASATAINELIREERAGELGRTIEIGDRPFAEGDRVAFTASDPKAQAVRTVEGPVREDRAGVRSGALGAVETVGEDLRVRLDDGRLVAFDPKEFNAIDYGYALTTFRANGSRADDVIVLAEPSMDRAAALVALSSHDRSLEIIAPDWAFESVDDLAKTFARERGKILARDIQDERVQSPRPKHRTDPTIAALDADRSADRKQAAIAKWVTGSVGDTVAETRAAIEKLRDYDHAVATLDQIDNADKAQAARAALEGGRDARVEAIFEASRFLGPEGFEKLPTADQALVRDLWEITIRPIAQAEAELERAEAAWRRDQPEKAESIEKALRALGTRAAMAVAPRPLRRVAAAALTVADLCRNTPRALLRFALPEPIQRIERTLRLVSHVVQIVDPTPRPTPVPRPKPAPRSRLAAKPKPQPQQAKTALEHLTDAVRVGDIEAIQRYLDPAAEVVRQSKTFDYRPLTQPEILELIQEVEELRPVAAIHEAIEELDQLDRLTTQQSRRRLRLVQSLEKHPKLDDLATGLIERLRGRSFDGGNFAGSRGISGAKTIYRIVDTVRDVAERDLPRLLALESAASEAKVSTPFHVLGFDRSKLARWRRLAPRRFEKVLKHVQQKIPRPKPAVERVARHSPDQDVGHDW